MKKLTVLVVFACACRIVLGADDFPKPYSPPCTERENVFEFTEKPKVKNLGNDRYEITFAVKGNCDVAVGIVDSEGPSTGSGQGAVVRHLGAGVLGANAPVPFQKNSLRQTIYWNGKDDLDVYHKTPEKLKVRVMLGLKPEFDKRLGGTSGKNIGGYVFGLAIAEDAVYVFTRSFGRSIVNIRKFDRDGNYVASLIPPPANLPEERLKGSACIEYEAGVRTLHGLGLNTVYDHGYVLPGTADKKLTSCQPALVGNRVYYINSGAYGAPLTLYYVYGDGGTDSTGMSGSPMSVGFVSENPRLAASPDGKWIYLAGIGNNVLYRKAVDSAEKATALVGDPKAPGSDDAHFSDAVQLDCDAQGRIYVTDKNNSRIQVFTPDGKLYKSLKVERPEMVRVHRKTGALYVKHVARIEGKSTDRITKFVSIDNPQEDFHMDKYGGAVMAIDSWSAKPRMWLAGTDFWWDTGNSGGKGPSVTIWEEDGKTFKKIADFDEEAKQEAGENYMGRWSGLGALGDRVACDPTREIVYYQYRTIFDLKTGKKLGVQKIPGPSDDIAIDKKGYIHVHFNPGFYIPGVGRIRPLPPDKEPGVFEYTEVPYDYGVEGTGPYNARWLGILPCKDQPGAKFFQDGIGANMRGDVVENCNIYYVPKFEEMGADLAQAGVNERVKAGEYADAPRRRWSTYIEGLKKLGEEIYFLRRFPGVPAMGATAWVFDSRGELKLENAALAGSIMAGPQIDEDGSVYFVNCRTRLFNNVPFLAGRAGVYGDTDGKRKASPLTGVLVKSKPNTQCRALCSSAIVPLEQAPQRPADAGSAGNSGEGKTWYEGAEWVYAGASPIDPPGGCTCPTQRLHLDWYKRVFVPEAYRHSIGVLDTAGNLIMHLGRYGNFDSGTGPKSKIPVGGDGIGMFLARFISGTDNYLVFDDRGERLAVLKLNYHAEETVGIGEVMSAK